MVGRNPVAHGTAAAAMSAREAEQIITFLTHRLAGLSRAVVLAYYRIVMIAAIEKLATSVLAGGLSWKLIIWARTDARREREVTETRGYGLPTFLKIEPKGWDDEDIAAGVLAVMGIVCAFGLFVWGLNQLLDPTYAVVQQLLNR